MLALSFFSAVFSSLLWLIYSIAYISDNTEGVDLSSLGITNLLFYILLVILPIFIIWVIFGYILQYFNTKNLNNNMTLLFKQMKKNQDYTDLIARIMLESEQQIKDGFIMDRIDILIADMNELIAEIISRAALATKEQIENMWGKVCNGGKWAFGKVIIEISQNQPNFQLRVFQKSQNDTVLAGTVLEFCARYQNILALLDQHDRERVFLNVIETGIFGKVFSILAPVADEIRKHRDVNANKESNEDLQSFEPKAAEKNSSAPLPPIMTARRDRLPEEKKSVFDTIGSFLKKDKKQAPSFQQPSTEKDPFSAALERSFGKSEDVDEPQIRLAEDDYQAPEIILRRDEDDLPRISMPDNNDEDNRRSFFNDDDDIRSNTEMPESPSFQRDSHHIPSFTFRSAAESENKFSDEPTLETKNFANNGEMTSTQRTLGELKKEWEGMKRVSKTKEDYAPMQNEGSENLSYPFGGWTDESNYNK